jgi:hypothetical protein
MSMPPLQPTRPWKPDLANIMVRPEELLHDNRAFLERRTDQWEARQMDRQDTERLHIGEYYSIQIDLNNLDIYNRSIGVDESSPQWLTDLVPKRSSYKEVLLLDKMNDEIPTRRLYKFQVNPAHHHRDSTGRGIIIVPGYPSILLATRKANPIPKLLMRDQQTREKRGRTEYDEKDGPKKLRTVR